jgi:hypothetical protein
MKAINITAFTNDNTQINAIKAVMKAFKIKFEISKVQGKPYNPDFVNMVLEAEKEIKQGKGLKVTSEGFDDLWK